MSNDKSGSGTPTSVLQVIKSFEHYFDMILDFEIENSRRGEPDFLLSNIEKANTILKWMPKRSNIKTILKDTYTWQLKLLKKEI